MQNHTVAKTDKNPPSERGSETTGTHTDKGIANVERHSVYSWKLVATDRVPDGKQVTESLREMEKQIKKDLEDNLLVYETRKMTLNYPRTE